MGSPIDKSIRVAKLDAAKPQLETAIRLYFASADPVSIHTLTSAAYNIIRAVNAKLGGEPMMLKDQLIGVNYIDRVFPQLRIELF